MPSSLHVVVLLALACVAFTNGFQLPSSTTGSRRSTLHRPFISNSKSSVVVGPLYFWGNRNNKDDTTSEDPTAEVASDDDDDKDNEEKPAGRRSLGSRLPFFAAKETTQEKEPSTSSSVAVAEPPKPQPKQELDTPLQRAQALRAQAERARLEADKMDAELTLRKITKLEKDMASAVAKDETENVERLQREMDALQAKVRGEAPKPITAVAPAPPKPTEETTTSSSSNNGNIEFELSQTLGAGRNELMSGIILDDNDMETLTSTVEKSPNFLKKLFAQMTEVDFVTPADINATEVATRMMQLQNMDYSFSSRPKPTFSQEDIQKAIDKKQFRETGIADTRLSEEVRNNETAKALIALEYEYYTNDNGFGDMEQLLDGEDFLKGFIDAVNKTQVDAGIEVLYPKCTRKEDAPLPKLTDVKMLMADVLPKASFTPKGEPEQVAGGYIIRGTSKFESGDELITAIDKEMEKKAMFKDKMTVLFTKDFTVLADDDGDFSFRDPDEEPPILYVMGPDIVPDRNRIALSVTTAFGIATSWYLSVYPFLLNPVLLKRTEEQLELADASMAYDLSWLSQLSLPLFITFMGIQIAHEAGHKLAGAVYGVPTTFPTFVPSLITGITSAVTQFKEPPKNKDVMFDIAMAGPLVGMLASIAALVVGSQLTLITDPNLLPALPLDILRQSTLGGGIIDAILGSGALSVPPGAEASSAVAGMTVSLHPVAVAGYIGLILNGLALLPIGTTDGGRITQALFGRGVKAAIGNLFLTTVFFAGVLGSDLFLFYFSFLIAFQTGNEIPARNEVDDVSFSRVLLATASIALCVLTLIPFQ